MNTTCKNIQETLATDGPRALRQDENAQQHLADCNECFAFLEALSTVEDGLGSMAELDAPDHVVESLLARPELTEAVGASPSGRRDSAARIASTFARLMRPRPLIWSSVAAGFLIFVFAFNIRSEKLDSPTEPFTVVRNNRESTREPTDKEREMLEVLGSIGRAEDDNLRLEDGRTDVSSLKPDAEPSLQAEQSAQLRKAGEDQDLRRQIVEKLKSLPVPRDSCDWASK